MSRTSNIPEKPFVSVILPTHCPERSRFTRTLRALAAQTLEASNWEMLIIDNGSTPSLKMADLPTGLPNNLRIVCEPKLGLSGARRRGFIEARGDLFVLVDDDNVLDPNYLSAVVELFSMQSRLGAAGGPVRPEFELEPPGWVEEFFPLLALRDLGPSPIIEGLVGSKDGQSKKYPQAAPIGAGMALRRCAALAWVAYSENSPLTDRCGDALTSGGDNDIVLQILHEGWEVGYFPELALLHLIPAARIDSRYLARLNHGIQKSWIQVLAKHGIHPWPRIAAATVYIRKIRAWFRYKAWSGRASHIRWRGACGKFEGRALISQ